MNKIQLIAPSYEGWTGFHLGLNSLSSYLINKGYQTEVIDLTKKKITNKEFVRDFNISEFVGITCTTPTYKSSLDLAGKIKEKKPNTKIILGGPHVSYTSRETLKNNTSIDLIVLGEGWETLEEILQNKSLDQIEGIAYRENGKIKTNFPRTVLKNLDLLPFVDRRSVEDYSIEHFSYGKKSTSMITSLGCISKCGFCSASDYWGKVRSRSVNNIVEELKLLKRKGFENVYFEDDIFIFNKKRVEDLSKKLLDENLNLDWHIETRVDSLDENLLELMAKAGLKDIFFGIESGNEGVLKNMNKKVDLEAGVKAFDLCKKYSVKTLAAIQFGYLGETDKSLGDTINYLHKIDPDKILPAVTSIYPGTPLFRQLKLPNDVYEISNLESEELRRWKVEHNNHGAGTIHPPFITGLSAGSYSKRETFENIYPGLSETILTKLSGIYRIFSNEFSNKMELPGEG